MFGKRKDGKLIKDMNGMNYIMLDIMPTRTESEDSINKEFDVTELVKYYEKVNKGKEKKDKITYFHLFCMAMAKTIYNRPYLNRFVMNGRFYQRNDVILSYVAKKEFTDDSAEVMQQIKVKEDDDIFSLREKISGRVNDARQSKESSIDKLVDNFGRAPKLIRRTVIRFAMFLDKHGLIPMSVTEDLLYYSTVIVSNLGSIDCKEGIYHHLSNVGTNSFLVTMGKIHKKEIINDEGKKEIRDFCQFGITMDERIADGFYLIKSMNLLQKIMLKPELLEGKANDKID